MWVHVSRSVCVMLAIRRVKRLETWLLCLCLHYPSYWHWRSTLMLLLLFCEHLPSHSSSVLAQLKYFCFQDSRQFMNVQALVLVFEIGMSGLLCFFFFGTNRRFLILFFFPYKNSSHAAFFSTHCHMDLWHNNSCIIYMFVMTFYELTRISIFLR